MSDKRYLDVEELSAYLGISKWLIYKFVKHREVPFIPFGRLVRFDRQAVDKWAERRMVRGMSRRPAAEMDWEPFLPFDVELVKMFEREAEEASELEASNGNL